MRIKVNDTVEVITGKNKGKRGKVMSIDRKSGRAVVAGVKQVSKHVKPSQRNPRGGILKIEQPIQLIIHDPRLLYFGILAHISYTILAIISNSN